MAAARRLRRWRIVMAVELHQRGLEHELGGAGRPLAFALDNLQPLFEAADIEHDAREIRAHGVDSAGDAGAGRHDIVLEFRAGTRTGPAAIAGPWLVALGQSG